MDNTAEQPASARSFAKPSTTPAALASLLGEAVRRLRIRARQEGSRTRARMALMWAARLQAFLPDVKTLETGR